MTGIIFWRQWRKVSTLAALCCLAGGQPVWAAQEEVVDAQLEDAQPQEDPAVTTAQENQTWVANIKEGWYTFCQWYRADVAFEDNNGDAILFQPLFEKCLTDERDYKVVQSAGVVYGLKRQGRTVTIDIFRIGALEEVEAVARSAQDEMASLLTLMHGKLKDHIARAMRALATDYLKNRGEEDGVNPATLKHFEALADPGSAMCWEVQVNNDGQPNNTQLEGNTLITLLEAAWTARDTASVPQSKPPIPQAVWGTEWGAGSSIPYPKEQKVELRTVSQLFRQLFQQDGFNGNYIGLKPSTASFNLPDIPPQQSPTPVMLFCLLVAAVALIWGGGEHYMHSYIPDRFNGGEPAEPNSQPEEPEGNSSWSLL